MGCSFRLTVPFEFLQYRFYFCFIPTICRHKHGKHFTRIFSYDCQENYYLEQLFVLPYFRYCSPSLLVVTRFEVANNLCCPCIFLSEVASSPWKYTQGMQTRTVQMINFHLPEWVTCPISRISNLVAEVQ